MLAACTGAEPPPEEPRSSAGPAIEAPAIVVPPSPSPIPHHPGETERLHPPLTTAELLALTGDGDGRVIAVGSRGTIVRSTDAGSTWRVVASGTGATLRAAWRSSSGSIFVAGDDGTILRSTDHGERWTPMTSGTTAALLHLAGNDVEVFAAGDGGTILRSHDAGERWQPIAFPPLAEEPVRGLGSTHADELWVLLRTSLWLTHDGGESWQSVANTKPPRNELAHLFVDASGFYATGRNAHDFDPDFFVLIGRADGVVERWTSIESRLIRPPVITAMSPHLILAGDGYDVLVSVDRGASFARSEQSADMQSPYALAKRTLWAAPDGMLFAAGSSGALMRSADHGETWALLDGGAREPLFGGAVTRDGTLLTAIANAVLRGRDGEWSHLPAETDRAVLNHCCTDVVVTDDGTIVAAGQGGVWRSTNDAKTWSKPPRSNDFDCCWSLWTDGRRIFGVDRDVVISSTDGGKTWKRRPIAKLLPDMAEGRFDISGLGDQLLVVGDRGIILHSADGGASWQRQDSGTTEYLYGGFLGARPTGAIVAFAVGERGTILRSTDARTWQSIATPTMARLLGVYGDAIRGEFYVVGGDGVLRSRDNGLTWVSIDSDERNLRSVFGDGHGQVFAAGDQGVVIRITGP